MNVSPEAYLFFCDMLFNSIKDEFFSNDQRPLVKDVWKKAKKINGKEVLFTKYTFDAEPMYFYNLRTTANKGGMVTVKNLSLVKALEFIEKVPAESMYKGGNWKSQAEKLQMEFEEKYKISNNDIYEKSEQRFFRKYSRK